MNANNPAGMQGWVKSVDPRSGRTFYANHITRKTQWDAPDGWVEDTPPPLPPYEPSTDGGEDEPLPSNWEVMHDPTTGKPFYVDHERKITQWTRPVVEKQQPVISYAPAATTTTSAAMARILQASSSANSSSNQTRSYTQEASYYHHPHSGSTDVDFSDTMPSLDFTVKKVADKFRLECPHCDALFTLSKRRHHCRLCGDVFCDPCSSHRVSLPLQGPEFEKPVRICDFCNKDVEQGNFFSMRRYLTPLTLFDPDIPDDDEENGAASASNVNAALCALTQDLDHMVNNAEAFEEKVTIPTKILVPNIIKHLNARSNTADRAVRAVASLLSMGSMVGKNEFAHAVYLYGKQKTFDRLLTILERSGSDRKTLFVQEKAAQALFYLTDPTVMSSVMGKHSEISSSRDDDDYGTIESLDIHRTLGNVLDHASNSANTSLQRWSTATVRNLVQEDQRRACLAINDVAARVASGESPSKLGYESFLAQLVSTGGVMILCSLIGADDSDTRAHATGALGATLTATRSIDGAMTALSEMSGGAAGSTDKKDGDIVRAITAGGGCGASVSQLLLSADNSVAAMGCDFVASLVLPILSDPMGSATISTDYDCRNDNSALGACREAAMEIASGSCLPALLSIARENGRVTRPIELRKVAMETLAATVVAVGEMGKAWADGKYEEGMEARGAPVPLTRAVSLLNEEQVIDVSLQILKSSSVQSLGSQRDTPSARIREAAGIILGCLTTCSAEAIMELHTRQVLSSLILSSNDPSMAAPSAMRGDAAPRCLGMLEAASSVLMFTWQHPSGASSELLDRLIEALDAGAITYLFNVLTLKMDWESRDKSAGGMKARSAACRLLCCLFGIALTDETAIGMRRLMDACNGDQSRRRSSKGPRNIMEAVLNVLQTSLNHAHRMLVGGTSRGPHYQAALLDLTETALLATGSMCGSSVAPGGGEGTMVRGEKFLAMRSDEFESQRRDVCAVACDVVIRGGRSGPSLLPTMLVGGFGEGAVGASLRLALAIAQNGNEDQHSKLALSGILVPVSDLLKTSLSRGDLYKFSAALALVRFCGPHVAAGTAGGVQSVRDAIKVATNVLTLPINPSASIQQLETQEALKSECIFALESLSKNASLWSAISTDALPSIVSYLHFSCDAGSLQNTNAETRCHALRAVLRIVQVPSHAVAAAEAGLSSSLGRMLKGCNNNKLKDTETIDSIRILTLEVLHVLVSNRDARRHCTILQDDTMRSVCAAIGSSVLESSKDPTDRAEGVTLFGINILHHILSEVESGEEIPVVLQSSDAVAYLDAVAAEPKFIRCLCATLLSKSAIEIERYDDQGGDNFPFVVPDLYGPPLPFVKKKCGGFPDTHSAATSLLFSLSVYACAIESNRSESFWKCVLLNDSHRVKDATECTRTASTLSALFLKLLNEDFQGFIPKGSDVQSYESLAGPLVRYRLLEVLKGSIKELTTEIVKGHPEIDKYVLSVLVAFNIPHICLSIWRDPALLELAYELVEMMVNVDPDEVLHLFVESKESVLSLFDLLNIDSSTDSSANISDIRRFLSSMLGKLAESGMLTEAVEKFGVRSSAIAAIASACLIEDENKDVNADDDEELTSNRLASGLMGCLVELCALNGNTKTLKLSSVEAESIAKSLGTKVCHMVISRFLERAKLQQYELEEDEDIMNAPDVAMLCALAQHETALSMLRTIGGFHALAQVAGEGEPLAMTALLKGCKNDPSLLLEADTYISVMSLFSEAKESAHWKSELSTRELVETAAFDLLAQLCSGSSRGRLAVRNEAQFQSSFERALSVVSDIVQGDTLVSSGPPPCEEPPPGGEDPNILDEEFTHQEESKAKEAGEVGSPKISIRNMALTLSAYRYLLSMLSVPNVRASIVENVSFVETTMTLVSNDDSPDLQMEALNVISLLSPYLTSESTFPAKKVGDLFLAALKHDGSFRICRNAAEGIQHVFDSLDTKQQRLVIEVIAMRYSKLLKAFSVARMTTDAEDRVIAGEVAYCFSSLFLAAVCKDGLLECYDISLVKTLVSTIQWHFDPRTTTSDAETVFWGGTTTQCLQTLSFILRRNEGSLCKAGITSKKLKENALMVARPAKAPRKAIDFPSALKIAIENGESTASLASRHVLKFIEKEF